MKRTGVHDKPVPQPFLHPAGLFEPESAGSEIFWVCVRTRPRWEKKFAEWMLAQRRPCFMPVFRRETVSGRKRRTSQIPLFPGFVFAGGDLGKKDFAATGCVAYVLRPRGAQETARLHRELRDGKVSSAATSMLDTEMKAASAAIGKASERASRSIDRIRAGRARGLVNSIDITMLDRRRPQRSMAQRQMVRFLMTTPEQLQAMFDAGLSYGEAAYALGFAKSSATEPAKLLTDLGTERHAVVERLDRARVRSGNVAVLLRLLDLTLREELDANTKAATSG